MKKLLYYLGIFLWGLIAGAFFADIFTSEMTIFGIIVDLAFGVLFSYFVYRCYNGLERIKNRTSKPRKEPPAAPAEEKKSPNSLNESLDLLRDCLSYRQTIAYPEIENQLNLISNYLHTFKDKDYEVSHYITDVLNQLLEAYKDVVTTPAKDTAQGKEILYQIQNSLALISTTLGKIYNAILDGKQLEVSSLVQGLRSKLTADGYIGVDDPFRRS